MTILPPQDLYHPVLPYRCKDKLTFPLCTACVEASIEAPLLQKTQRQHPSHQRALTGTWCTPGLQKTLEKGYQLLKVDQVYHFPKQKTGLFQEYVDTWLQLKEEASGYPDDCVTAAQQREHCALWFEREGIVLFHQNIAKNPGRRTLAYAELHVG